MNPETHQASEIYSADGKLIGKFFNENRTPVKFEDVNPTFWKVLVDTEDERFYKHHGIDFTGMLAAAKDMIVHHDARGASTITQQLAKTCSACARNILRACLATYPASRCWS